MLRSVLILISSLFGITVNSQKPFSPENEALKLFNAYKPTIEKTNNAIVDTPKTITGDLNGDGKVDCIIFFVMTSKDGGNAIVGEDAAIYINQGNKMKVIGSFNLDICYGVE